MLVYSNFLIDMIKRLFELYSETKKGIRVITLRPLLKMMKDFKIYEKLQNCDQSMIEVLYSKHQKKQHLDFKTFIDFWKLS